MKLLLEWLEPKNFFFLLSLIAGTFLAFGVTGITFTFDYQKEKLWIGIAFAHILFATVHACRLLRREHLPVRFKEIEFTLEKDGMKRKYAIDDVILHYVSCDSAKHSKTENVKLSDFLKEAWKPNGKNESRSIEFKDSNGNKTATITETHRR